MKQMTLSDRRSGSRVQGLLDLGSGEIKAAVAVIEPSIEGGLPRPRIAGVGAQRSRGVKAGVLTDIEDAEQAARAAIAQAERAAGVTIDGVFASATCGRVSSRHFTAGADVTGAVVSDADLQRVVSAGQAYAERDGRVLLHMNRLGFRIDGAAGVRDPRGLAARHLAVQLHAVTMDEPPLRNLLWLVDRCHLNCDGLVATPYASGLAATTAEERELGVTSIDLGAGATSIATFANGAFLAADVVPVGSQHLTFDIARALQTPLAEAERLKTLYGAVISAQSDDIESISYPLAGDDPSATSFTTRARLAEIIRPRMQQICGLVQEKLTSSEAVGIAPGRLVVTGGASMLIGIADFFAQALSRPTRLGKPVAIAGLAPSSTLPQLSTLAGLALAAAGSDASFSTSFAPARSRSYFGRVGTWLKAGF